MVVCGEKLGCTGWCTLWFWSDRRDSNPRPSAWEANRLALRVRRLGGFLGFPYTILCGFLYSLVHIYIIGGLCLLV